MGPAAVAGGKKNARRQRAWLVFEDESGLSQQPVVRRTWAPRGQTPVLTHVLNNWKRLSVAAALAFRWDGRRTRLYFQTRPGTYTGDAIVRAGGNLAFNAGTIAQVSPEAVFNADPDLLLFAGNARIFRPASSS